MDIDANAIAVNRKQRAEDGRVSKLEAELRSAISSIKALEDRVASLESAPTAVVSTEHHAIERHNAAKRLTKKHGQN